MKHSPKQIETILHFYYSPERHPQQDVPAIKDVIAGFQMKGLLVPDRLAEVDYKITDLGRAWVEMICETPLPVAVIVDPRDAHVSRSHDCPQCVEKANRTAELLAKAGHWGKKEND